MNTKDREIRLTREFDAPRQLVFEAWTEPEKIGQWWGPDGFSTTTKKMNFEIGGEWIFTMHGPDGTDYPNHIIYTGIVKPKQLKYDHYGDQNKDVEPHFKVTVNFKESNETTTITMRMVFSSPDAKAEAIEFGAVEGGKQTLGRLDKYLKRHTSFKSA